MSALAIIPARGGSKGIPRKNIMKIAGKPLIAWTIEHALQAKGVDRVIVSTDDSDIADTSMTAGAQVPFKRPDEQASDTATTESVIRHTLSWLKDNENYNPELIILLQPTSPIRFSGRIDEAIAQLKNENSDSLLSVVPFESFLWSKYPEISAHYNFAKRPRRQDIKPNDVLFKETGSIYITKQHVFEKYNNRLGGRIALFEMNEAEGFEIDTLVDWWMIEGILQNLNKT